ncbi:MAG: flagellin [Bdellovibrionales bacterium]|nr:flagellin [Bdellovibrionales bacterium]
MTGESFKSNSLGIIRNLNSALNDQNRSFNRLSSGKRINKASDDAAGLAIAESLLADAAVFNKASENINSARSLTSIQDGALGQVTQIGTRLQELSVQAANGTLSNSQREALNSEFQALKEEASRIVSSTEFNGNKVFSGESTTFQVGNSSDPTSQISVEGSNVAASLASIQNLDISSASGAMSALEATKNLVSELGSTRGKIGAAVSRLETADSNIKVAIENLRSAESRIRDVDVAEESAKNIASRIRARASEATLAQGKLSAENVLRLLK